MPYFTYHLSVGKRVASVTIDADDEALSSNILRRCKLSLTDDGQIMCVIPQDCAKRVIRIDDVDETQSQPDKVVENSKPGQLDLDDSDTDTDVELEGTRQSSPKRKRIRKSKEGDRERIWSDPDRIALIGICRDLNVDDKYTTPAAKKTKWKLALKRMNRLGYNYTSDQCKNQWIYMKRQYLKYVMGRQIGEAADGSDFRLAGVMAAAMHGGEIPGVDYPEGNMARNRGHYGNDSDADVELEGTRQSSAERKRIRISQTKEGERWTDLERADLIKICSDLNVDSLRDIGGQLSPKWNEAVDLMAARGHGPYTKEQLKLQWCHLKLTYNKTAKKSKPDLSAVESLPSSTIEEVNATDEMDTLSASETAVNRTTNEEGSSILQTALRAAYSAVNNSGTAAPSGSLLSTNSPVKRLITRTNFENNQWTYGGREDLIKICRDLKIDSINKVGGRCPSKWIKVARLMQQRGHGVFRKEQVKMQWTKLKINYRNYLKNRNRRCGSQHTFPHAHSIADAIKINQEATISEKFECRPRAVSDVRESLPVEADSEPEHNTQAVASAETTQIHVGDRERGGPSTYMQKKQKLDVIHEDVLSMKAEMQESIVEKRRFNDLFERFVVAAERFVDGCSTGASTSRTT